MGYADVVRQCKQIREAAKERLASEERLEQLHKGFHGSTIERRTAMLPAPHLPSG